MGLLRWLFRSARKSMRQARRAAQWSEWVDMRSEVTQRGELVASKAERRIADVLDAIGIDYEYEERIEGYVPDFLIKEWDLIIEYWGMDPPGSDKRRRKVGAYKRAGYDILNLENEDWAHLEHRLLRKLYRWDQGVFKRYTEATGIRF